MALRFGATLVAIVCAAGCGGSSTSSSATPDPAPAGSTTVTMPSGASGQTTGAYTPNPLTVTAGTVVSFLNSDSTTHTSTADAGAWSSGNLAPGKRFNLTTAARGQFTYHCTIHPNMVGTLTVQ